MEQLTFKKLEWSDESLFTRDFIINNPYADTSHATLMYWWCLERDARIALLYNNICIESYYPSTDHNPSFSLFGKYNIDASLNAIFDYQNANNLPFGVHFVPAYTVSAIKNNANFVVKPNRDIAEYVMSIEEQALLSGASFKRLRNKVAHFEKLSFIPYIDLATYKVNQDNAVNTLKDMQNINASQKNDREKEEDVAIAKLLSLHDKVNITCYVLKNKETVIAMGLIKELNDTTLNFCHLRYSVGYVDLFTYFFHKVCKQIHRLQPQYKHINIEQDLGIEGMRTHKLRMRPAYLLEKYSIYPTDTTL